MSLQSLRAEITSLRLERDEYRVKYGKARTEVASLQARLDEVNDQVADLKRAFQHAQVEAGPNDLPQPKLQVILRLHLVRFFVHEKHENRYARSLFPLLRILWRSRIELLSTNVKLMTRSSTSGAPRL
jgi:multidrug resistance efflux pump